MLILKRCELGKLTDFYQATSGKNVLIEASSPEKLLLYKLKRVNKTALRSQLDYTCLSLLT